MDGNDVFRFLNEKYPLETACDFDNPGFLVGDSSRPVSRILVALDCDRAAAAEAKERGCELIVTHHPVIFSGLKNVTAGSVVYSLIESGISVLSMHTNLDAGADGVNDCLCRAVGLSGVTVFSARDGFALRRGTLAPTAAAAFAVQLRKKLGGVVRYADGGHPVSRLLVCSGSGGEYLEEVTAAGCDALLTGDVKHHQFIAAADAGISLFDAGHFATEDVVVEPLAALLRGAFPEARVFTRHETVLRFV